MRNKDKGAECKERFAGGAIFICYKGIERSQKAVRAFRDAIPGITNIDYLEGGTYMLDEKYKTDDELKMRLGHYSNRFLIYDRGSKRDATQSLENAQARFARCGLNYQVVDVDTLASYVNECGLDPNRYFNRW